MRELVLRTESDCFGMRGEAHVRIYFRERSGDDTYNAIVEVSGFSAPLLRLPLDTRV